MLAPDTETTGVDSWHGSKPFLVTMAYDNHDIYYWRWDVNPKTRMPIVPKGDIQEIEDRFHAEDEIVFQNAKFDIRMMGTVGIKWTKELWKKTRETLMCSHILNSGLPKDLTFSCMYYLKLDIGKYDKAIKKNMLAARRMVEKYDLGWMIAKEGLPTMPSAKKVVWKNDLWLPFALKDHFKGNDDVDHEELDNWCDSVIDYANSDSEATMMLYKRQMQLIEKRGLMDIYMSDPRLGVIPVIFRMENKGIQYSGKRLDEQITSYQKEADRAARTCIGIARSKGYDLTLPKSGNNESLVKFVFGSYKDREIEDETQSLMLPVVKKADSGGPSLDKDAMQIYQDTLPTRSKASTFIKRLGEKRQRDTAITYMHNYERFAESYKDDKGREYDDWFVIHSSINPSDTYTLRCSSKQPNSQNVSKQKGFNIRYAFGPPPGREWWSLDYNNLEYRLTAYESGEQVMIDLFEKPNEPPFFGSFHLLNVSIIYEDLWKTIKHESKDSFGDKYPGWYRSAKEFGFAVNFGAQLKSGTADRAARRPGSHLKVLNRLKKNTELRNYWINFAKEKGYVETIPDKTVDPNRGYPIYCPRDKYGRIPETKPFSNHIQSTAGWCINKAMVRIQDYFDRNSMDDHHMIMQVHDELVFDFPFRKNKGNLPKVRKIKQIMEQSGDDIGIPLTAGIDYHPNNWSVSE